MTTTTTTARNITTARPGDTIVEYLQDVVDAWYVVDAADDEDVPVTALFMAEAEARTLNIVNFM